MDSSLFKGAILIIFAVSLAFPISSDAQIRTDTIALFKNPEFRRVSAAQVEKIERKKKILLKCRCGSQDSTPEPIYILRTDKKQYLLRFKKGRSIFDYVSGNQFESLSIFKDSTTVKKFGDQAIGGAVVVTLKQGVQKKVLKALKKDQIATRKI